MSCFSKKHRPYSLLIIQQSECIIRAQKFVNRVSIKEEFAGDQSDSVDVTIRVLDSWSTRPQIAISTCQNSLGLNERFFFFGIVSSLITDSPTGKVTAQPQII